MYQATALGLHISCLDFFFLTYSDKRLDGGEIYGFALTVPSLSLVTELKLTVGRPTIAAPTVERA